MMRRRPRRLARDVTTAFIPGFPPGRLLLSGERSARTSRLSLIQGILISDGMRMLPFAKDQNNSARSCCLVA
jgi:hypothetical protein